MAAAVDGVVRYIHEVCRTAVDGRRAARAIARWAGRSRLSEPDFQLLWCLRPVSGDGIDQTTLARELALSPAQVSATVERLRAGGWIEQRPALGDRRRNLWQLTSGGQRLLTRMLHDAIAENPFRRKEAA